MSVLKTFSQTSLKHFEEGCPRKWESMWVLKTVPFYSNASMDKGSYLEYLSLGGGATEDEVTDLPRKKNGDKYTHQIRIENQAMRFKNLFDPKHEDFLGFEIEETQLELFHPNGRDRGTLDFTTSKNVIWDQKFTADAKAVRHPKHWGHKAEDLDVTQAVWYADLWRENYGVLPDEFRYIIFDVTPSENIEMIRVVVDEDDIQNLNNRKENVIRKVEEFEKEGYPERPAKYECMSCPLECWSRIEPFNVD